MQGVILLGFRRFVREVFGDALWRSAQERSGSGGRIYLPVQTYAYPELIQLVDAVAQARDINAQALLEDFGAFLAPDLVRMYGTLLDPRWKLADILANMDKIVQRAAALKNEERAAPAIHCSRTTSRDIHIMFSSRQRLCAMVRGVIRGLAAHLSEPAQIAETSCMLLGQRHCEIIVNCSGTGTELGRRRTIPPGAPGPRPVIPRLTAPRPLDAALWSDETAKHHVDRKRSA